MTIGQIARKILGRRFHFFGRLYRSLFVDLGVAAHSIAPHIPPEATILDVGGGDGEPLNYLLSLRPDIHVTMIDPSPRIGESLDKRYSARVEMLPGTSMDEYSVRSSHKPDVVLISDVLHHIPVDGRDAFFAELRRVAGDRSEMRIIVKDLEPGYFRTTLGRIADRYVSGDRNVSFIRRADIVTMMSEAFGNGIAVEETDLFDLDGPNFALVFLYKRA